MSLMESTEDLYEDAPFGYLSALDDGSIVRVNNTFLQLSGYTRDEILATTFTALLTTGSQLFYQTRLLPVLHLQGAVSEVALTLRHADTTDVPVLVNSSLVEASATSPRITRTAFLGSSERREYERDLLAAQRSAETSERRVRILQDASNAFGVCTTKEELATALTLTVRDAFAASEAALLLADDSGTLHSIAGDHPLSAVMPAFVHGPELDAFSTGEIVTVSDIRTADELYPHWSAALVSTRLEAVSAVPVLGDAGATLGVLVCFFARSHEFSPQEIELHSALARQAALVLVRIRLQRQLEHLALHDQLTGLANRQLLSERLEPALEREGDLRRPLAVIVIDLDGFKAINDGFGHATGDLVLRQVALRMESVVRGTDLAGRIGGDEFVIICDDADERVAAAIAGRVRDAIASPLDGFETALPLTASIGVAVHAADGVTRVTGKAMFEAADSAMYRSKNAGKNAVSVTRV